ncbi:MAG: DUF2018 family protein [Calditrichota bacterium]
MGDNLDRIERDRALFERTPADQLFYLLKQGDHRIVAKALAKALELQIVTEEIAREAGVDINDDRIAEYIDAHRAHITEQVERSITAFICSIVSQEG